VSMSHLDNGNEKKFDIGDRVVGRYHEGVITRIKWGMVTIQTDSKKTHVELIKYLVKVVEENNG
jgi:hypothetical protein